MWTLAGALRLFAAVALLGLTQSLGGEPRLATVRVRVYDAATAQPLPCRLTVVDESNALAVLQTEKAPGIAVRPGVLYTATGKATFYVPQGRYTLYVTRGSEYGLATQSLDVHGVGTWLILKLAREVVPKGYIGCDTHIHTLTYSGHGDCTAEERMVTLAGEGIELPIATEHNAQIDYTAAARATGTSAFFTPVIGNEITTNVGHFNAFPMRPGVPPPPYRLNDRKQILSGIRSTPDVGVVILNHPSDIHAGFLPTDPALFHAASGESLDGASWAFDGIEVINSGAMQSDFMKPYRDWFALLNRGQRTVGVGASDSHDVNRFIVGQARTYIASSATRPDRIDVQEACRSIRDGRVLISLGLLTEMWVEDKYGVGDLALRLGKDVRVHIRVRGPSWIDADRVELFANGEKIAARPIVHAPGAITKADLTFAIRNPGHDLWLVAIASGPGVTAPYWPIARPYQPTRPDWDPRVIGSTSPIRLDGDGDGRYSSPRDYARALVDAVPAGPAAAPDRLMTALQPFDQSVAVQAAALCRDRGIDIRAAKFQQAIENSAPQVRMAFTAYLRLLPTRRPNSD